MRIKTKIALAVAFLFFVILAVIGVSIFYLQDLSSDAKNILKDNYESLAYCKRIVGSCDSLAIDFDRAVAALDRSITLQEENVTETGERELTVLLRNRFEQMKASGFA